MTPPVTPHELSINVIAKLFPRPNLLLIVDLCAGNACVNNFEHAVRRFQKFSPKSTPSLLPLGRNHSSRGAPQYVAALINLTKPFLVRLLLSDLVTMYEKQDVG